MEVRGEGQLLSGLALADSKDKVDSPFCRVRRLEQGTGQSGVYSKYRHSRHPHGARFGSTTPGRRGAILVLDLAVLPLEEEEAE